MKLKPLGKRVLVKPQKDEVTKGGLVLPGNVSERGILTKGEVIAIGSSKLLEVGDKIFYMKMAVDVLDIDGQEFSIIETKHILAKYE